MSDQLNKIAENTAAGEEDADLMWRASEIFRVAGPSDLEEGDGRAPTVGAMDENQLRLAASVFANTRDGIMITDDSGCILDVNRAFAEMTGYSAKELIGKTPQFLKSDMHSQAFYEHFWQSLLRQGAWRGEVWNKRKNGELFAELLSISAVHDAAGSLTHYVAIYSDISELKESQQRLEHLAYYDALTHLPNRVLLADRIQQALVQAERHGTLMAVCFLDLDLFKPINDQYGHQAGDQLLVEVSQRLKESVRAGDTVARLGGDEFALILSDIADPQEVEETLARVLSKVSMPYSLLGFSATISASVGYTLVPPDGGDSDSLLRHADQAMYIAKLDGRNRAHLFDIERDIRIRNEKESQARIRKALEDGEFCLYYQPKVNMRRGVVYGVEALIRWHHPEKGLLLPAEFLLALGDSDLLCEIGDWVIASALGQVAAWQAEGLDMSVSVNISGGHLLHPEFVSRLAAHLQQYPSVAPDHLELEILETAALGDMVQVLRVIESCSALGVCFALDDFGTGYSSLTYLKRLPVKTLKIDQSFISNMLDAPEDMAIVEGILGLNAAFNRHVVAEGVESVEHGVLLLQLNCDLAQGFGIARPMPASDFPAWIAAFVPDPLWAESAARFWKRVDFPLLTVGMPLARSFRQLSLAARQRNPSLLPVRLPRLADSRFGRWLNSEPGQRYMNFPAWQEIEPSYLRLQRVATEVSVRVARGHDEKAIELLPELQACDTALMSLIRQMQDFALASPTN